MKKSLLFFLALGLSAAGFGQDSPLAFDSRQWNFGRVGEQDAPMRHKFGFVNRGSKPIVIEDVLVTCGCTTTSFSKAPVMPGKRGVVEIAYNPAKGGTGTVMKEIAVVSGGGKNSDKLQIRGSVTPRPRTVEEDYPVELLPGVRLTTSFLNFGYAGQGTARSMSVGYINTSDRQVELEARPAFDSGHFKVAAHSAPLCAGCRGELTFTCDLTGKQAWGALSDETWLYVNGRRAPDPVRSVAVGVDDFGRVDGETAPAAKFAPFYHNFGEAGRDAPLVKEMTLSNDGKTTLVVRHVKCEDKITTSLVAGTKVEPGKAHTFTMTISPDKSDMGRIAGNMTVIINDPKHPRQDLRLVVNIK
ncbi:MAG: DUF1573 domain-containing protein [Rikenellaceae bacterium]|jgi:hypothetical protein|nr:DUF1573 domain-containing protein [Rikenellaceae bacterium]